MGGTRRKLQILLILLGLALATAIAFEEVRLNDFVRPGDGPYLLENPQVRNGLTQGSVSWALTSTTAGSWRPLTWLSHMLDVTLFGLNPAGHHLTSLLLHIGNTLLLFGLLARMSGRLWPSALVAGLFGCHPLQVEAVAWIAQRGEVLSTAFGLAAIWAYLGYARRGSIYLYLIVFILMMLGLMARPTLVTLPLLLLLLDYWPLERLRSAHSLMEKLLEKVPLLALSAAASLVTLLAQSAAADPEDRVPLALRAANAVVSYLRYLWHALCPVNLSAFYPHPYLPGGTPWAEWQVAGAGLLLLGISVGVVIRATRQPYMVVGWLWFLGALVPAIGLVQVGRQAMTDTATYLPLVGLFIVVAWGGADLIPRQSPRQALTRSVAILSVTLVLGALLGASRAQVRVWRDSGTLYTRALEVNPGDPIIRFELGLMHQLKGELEESIRHYREAVEAWPGFARAHYGLGLALDSQGNPDEAIRHYRQAVRLRPDYALAHNDLGVALASKGKIDSAISHLRQAVRADLGYADAHYNLGLLLSSQGRIEEAVGQHRRAVQANPDHAEANYNLGLLLGSQGKVAEAIGHYQEAVRANPDHAEASYNLGLLLGSLGEFEQAIRAFRQALRARPGYPAAHNNLGVMLAAQGQLDEAIGHYREVLRARPDNAQAHYNLGMVLTAQEKSLEAIHHYREALRVKPDYADAHNNLGVALATQGRYPEAVAHYREALRINPDDENVRRNLDEALAKQPRTKGEGSLPVKTE
jgi:tetratricopeptide (TPR) repeat protein